MFQKSVQNKFISLEKNAELEKAYERYVSYFHDRDMQARIIELKEEEYQSIFLQELFVKHFGYTLKPDQNFNLVRELKNPKDSKKADGGIIIDGKVKAVIELKSAKTIDFTKIELQAFGYKNSHTGCRIVFTSNFEKARLYIDDRNQFIEFSIFELSYDEYALLSICLHVDNLTDDKVFSLLNASLIKEKEVTSTLYSEYSAFRLILLKDLILKNPEFEKKILLDKCQKLLDRLIFIFYAEDKDILPVNTISRILSRFDTLRKIDNYIPLIEVFNQFFNYIDKGYNSGKQEEKIFAYNGGLFTPDPILSQLKISDNILETYCLSLSGYDFKSEVDVDILGHIFEQSISELEQIEQSIDDNKIDTLRSRRKEDGVFYTPRLITRYLVDETLGNYCQIKKSELGIESIDFKDTSKFYNSKTGRLLKEGKLLLDKVNSYREFLLDLKILDPACGSGAFLNQTLDFLLSEHSFVSDVERVIKSGQASLFDIEAHILENNIYGVDINTESVEIARLSLWIRTAKPHRKLNDLSNNIKSGNSLIEDKDQTDVAFFWRQEFEEVFAKNGGFDVVIGNPPYGAKLSADDIKYFRKRFTSVIGHAEAYYLFTELAINTLCAKGGLIGYITPNAWMTNKYARELRRLMLESTTITKVVDFRGQVIFEDANVDTSVFVLTNTGCTDSYEVSVGIRIGEYYQKSIFDWIEAPNNLITFAEDSRVDRIINKVKSERVLSDDLDISNGIKPYQVGYGLNYDLQPLTKEDVKNKIYHSDKPLPGYNKEYKGKGIRRYHAEWTGSYIKWGKWLMSPKGEHYFKQPKILLRQIISSHFYAAIDEDGLYADQSVYICTHYPEEEQVDLYYYLTILNSTLYGFYFRKFYSEEDDLFPKIKVNELKTLPLPEADKDTRSRLSELARELTSKMKQLKAEVSLVVDYLEMKFDITANRKIESWTDYKPSVISKEIKKLGGELNLDSELEFFQLLKTKKVTIVEIEETCLSLDKEIDRSVFELFGISQEEIDIILN